MPVYLLHLDQRFGHAGHYVGFAMTERTLERRLAHHANGTGARLLQAAKQAGITWTLARVWPDGDRTFERRLKSHSGTRYCPVCRGPAALRRMTNPKENATP